MKKNSHLWWAWAAVWICMMVTDWLFHGIWLQPWYQQTQNLWRASDDLQTKMWAMWMGRAVFAWAFVWIYSKGISNANPWHQAFRFGFAILLVAQIPHLMGQWATTPYPMDLIWRWLFIDTFQAFLCSWVVTWMYRSQIRWSH